MFDLIKIPSPHFNSRNHEKIKGIVLHCLGYKTLQHCIYSLLYYDVSAHYLVPCESMAQIQAKARQELKKWNEHPKTFNKDKGFHAVPEWKARWVSLLSLLSEAPFCHPDRPPVIEFVKDQDRAWHAGNSHWHHWSSTNSLNSCTIGIEFQCPGYATNNDFYHFEPYPEGEKKTGILLIQSLMSKYDIDPTHLIAHSDTAWDRQPIPKTDPGPTFFWRELADQGVGYLPPRTGEPPFFHSFTETVRWVQSCLKSVGYQRCPLNGKVCALTQRVLSAYRMHFLTEEAHLVAASFHDPALLITPLLLSTLSAHVRR